MASNEDDLVEQTEGYVAPKKVDLETLKNLDADDEALVRWKEKLLAGAPAGDSDDPRNVIVEKMSFVTEGRDDIELDLTGDLSELKGKEIIIKEGCTYRLKITFKVQRDVVAGLKYVQGVYRAKVRVDKANHMLGSYGPKAESQSAQTPLEEAPSGMLARGHYVVKSKFVDDDNETHLAWEWGFHLKKDWQ